ncbi:DUF2169 family type VI secretion system accessory protein [Chondromyces crocatus]|uniref:DUF2169 domain-containing protein n=1 Tax=Chondromyces crocatus TaxID=52 RepID=A0A0K1ENE0_CHOCO|nr:DUF2169 domain-containing protein [Chondromyces crocatus]AKT42450.1 uncharacterized protein CMC5_066760 [Chondromyces crocatus]
MKIIKPQQLGLLTRVFEDDSQPYLVLSAMAMFPMNAPRKFLHEVALWKVAMDQLGKDAVLDACMSKQRAEVLVAGKAFAAGGEPTTATSVRVQMGSVDKQLYVIGDRFWKTTGPSDAVPFTEMPVTWERAFGGEGFANNPLGRGFKPVQTEGSTQHPLPNVEDPKHLVKSTSDRPEPVGLGPIDQSWPQRMSKVGTYDREWLDTRFPGFAKDFDWEFFNVAPADQRVQGYFALDERFRIEGMHPSERAIESRLPGATARFFVIKKNEKGEEELVEAASRIDTVFLFPNVERALVVFRGMIPVTEDDGADVKHIIAAFEDPTAPRSVDHYRGVLAKRLDKRRGPIHSLLDDDLMPPWEEPPERIAEDDWNDMAALVELEGLQHATAQRKVDKELAAARAKYIELGLDPADFDKKVPPPVEQPPKDLRKVPAYLDRVELIFAQAEKESKAQEAEAMARARAQCEEMGLDFDKLLEEQKGGGGGPPKLTVDKELDHLRELRQMGQNIGADTSALDAMLADPTFEANLRRAEKQLLDGYRVGAHFFPPADLADAESSRRLREELLAAHARGESLAGRDFTGADLSGVELSGVNLTEALLERVNLSGARLRGAKLRGAVLTRANLTGADLEDADLRKANLGGADLREARLSDADLVEAVLYQADLRGAGFRGAMLDRVQLLETKLTGVDFSEVRADGVMALEVDLTGARFVGARFENGMFLKCKLEGADFTGASLPKTALVECRCDRATFTEATLESTRFALGTTFAGADFRRAKMKLTLLRGCEFTGADFTEAVADDCDFSEAVMTEARLYHLSAKRSLFMRTRLERADLRGANLMMAILQKARLHGADLRGANLFRADMAKVRGDNDTNFKDAYLVQIRVVPEKNQPRLLP